jgi:hypothetical protein
VLLDVLPRLTRPVVKEAVVRSLSTAHAHPAAASALLDEFRRTSDGQNPALKWAIGNALSTVTTIQHVDALLELALDRSHGAGRQMVVDRLARFSKDDRIVQALMSLLADEDVALHAMAGLRRRLGPAAALESTSGRSPAIPRSEFAGPPRSRFAAPRSLWKRAGDEGGPRIVHRATATDHAARHAQLW